jgi:CubicO group peptidase (beta-lactamase class C family)
MKHLWRVLWPAVFPFFLTACVPAPPAPPEHIPAGDFSYADTYLDWLIRREMKRSDIPGCAVTVVSRDRVIAQKTYGITDVRSQTPVTASTVFRAGSITKSLTALAVMKLREEGRLDPDAPLDHYLPEFSIKSRFPDARPITPRLLLSHQAGLMGDYLHGIMGAQRLTPQELVQALHDEYLDAPPGERFLYSNTGYGLLGALIERVTGRRYEEYVNTEILEPMGMEHAALELTPVLTPRLASGHMPHALGFFPGGDKKNAPVAYLPIRDSAAGALLTDICDLGTYVQFLLRDKETDGTHIITNASFMEMIRVQPAPERVFVAVDYGLGLMRHTFRYPGVDDIIHHSGNVNGFYSMMLFSPSRGLGLALLTNSSGGFFPSYRICSLALRRYLEADGGAPVMPPAQPETPPVSLPPETLDSLTGYYALLGLTLTVSRSGQELRLSIPAINMELALVPREDGRFAPELRALGIFPVDIAPWIGFDKVLVRFAAPAGSAGTMELEGTAGAADVVIAFRRTTKPADSPAADRYLGRYDLIRGERDRETLDLYLPIKSVHLEKKDGWIVLSCPELGQGIGLAMEFINDREALLLGTNETVFFDENTLRLLGLTAKRK